MGCIPQNVRVVLAGKVLVSLLAGVLLLSAGCSTTSQKKANFASVIVPAPIPETIVTEDPALAAPPVDTPRPEMPPIPKPQVTTVPTPAAPVPVRSSWITLDAWAKAKGWPAPRRRANDIQPTFEVTTPAGIWVVRPGTEISLWNNVQLRLGYAPQYTDGMALVNTLDLEKNLEPLLRTLNSPPSARAPVIVLDPGHGGIDSGTPSVFPGQSEKEFTLDWALRLRDVLTARGWQVKLTRTNDCDLSIPARVAFADQVKADLFVSLHFNSAGYKRGESGMETYCLTPRGLPSNLTRGYAEDLQASFPNNTFDEQNLKLALALHRELLQTSRAIDRGVRRARFLGVLRGQQRPAVLVEGGYLSNPQEAKLIASSAYRQKLADALAKALVEWSGRDTDIVASGQ